MTSAVIRLARTGWIGVAVEVALLALAAYGIAVVAWTAYTGDMADAVSYVIAVDRWLAGGSPYTPMQMQPYELHTIALGLGYIYPPASLPLLVPLTWGGDGLLRAWAFGGGLAVGVVAALMVRERGRRIALLAFGVTMLLPMDVGSGQASAWVAAGIGLAYLYPRWGSVAAASAGSLKIYPMLAVRWWPALLVPISLGLATIGLWSDWLTAWMNGWPGCPDWALPSLACATGATWPGYALAAVFLVGAWRAPRPIGFFLLTVAMILPAPDLFRGYLLVPYLGLLAAAPAMVRLQMASQDQYAARGRGPCADRDRLPR
ncbi:MAG: hypothetical protein IT341_10285 [Chloroflexi bacterium]|nr:hypothetical protein [Chloroflexota bacterium]